MNRKLKIFYIVLLIAGALSCDTGLGLMTTKITGKIIFLNTDKKPDDIESVWVIAASKELFESPSLDDVVISDKSVNLSQKESPYEIFTPPGTFIILAAVYRKKGEDWNYLNILGRYGFDPVNFTYYDTDPIVISKKNPVANGYDIICDWGFIFLNESQGNR
jgi:hypothetical protein